VRLRAGLSRLNPIWYQAVIMTQTFFAPVIGLIRPIIGPASA
jgi:hypothetical protein